MRVISRLCVAVAGVSLAVWAHAAGGPLRLESAGSLGPVPVTESTTYPLTIDEAEANYALEVRAVLKAGSGGIKLISPDGSELYQRPWGTRLSEDLVQLPQLGEAGEYQVLIETENAVGEWRVRVVELPPVARLKSVYWSGPLLIVVGLGFLLGWRWKANAPWRWFAVGALVRVAAFLLTVIGALAFHLTLRDSLEDSLPYVSFLAVESVVNGVASGVAMLAAILLAGFAFSPLRATCSNAVALGAGAGAGEALLSGVVTTLGTSIVFGTGPKSGKWLVRLAYDSALTPLLPLVEPSKFTCVIVCLMAASGLALLALGSRRFAPAFWSGLLLAGLYAGIGLTRVWSLDGAASKWWILCGALPFAAISVPILSWMSRTWRDSMAAGDAPMEEYLRLFDEEEAAVADVTDD
ncbi:MAG: hypothetical protein IT364_04135 [Candidatus Hydrogenedentes bacterium]|nr:hypothetical protein [Candidatus Hydrogenedentota bacterium]